MPTDIPLTCRCGVVRGVVHNVSPKTVNRIVCHCDDCQAYATFLGTDGIVNDHGGTDISQLSQNQITITEGADQLAVMQLSDKGLFRWYTACCRTPVANTLSTNRVLFAGLVHSFVDHDAHNLTRDQAMGPSQGGVMGKFAIGDPATLDAAPTYRPRTLLRSIRKGVGWWWSGDRTRTPFFTADGAPAATPHVQPPASA